MHWYVDTLGPSPNLVLFVRILYFLPYPLLKWNELLKGFLYVCVLGSIITITEHIQYNADLVSLFWRCCTYTNDIINTVFNVLMLCVFFMSH